MNANTSTSAFSRATTVDDNRKVLRFRGNTPRITINDTACAWREDLEDRLEELIQLPEGWDGYDGRPVSFANAVFALGMLERLYMSAAPPPELVPGYNGDLQAEWHVGGVDIELHVRAPNDVHAWRVTPATGIDGEEIPLTNDFTIVGTWIKELADSVDAVGTAAA